MKYVMRFRPSAWVLVATCALFLTAGGIAAAQQASSNSKSAHAAAKRGPRGPRGFRGPAVREVRRVSWACRV